MKSKSQRSLNDLRDKATIALHADFKFDEVSPTIKATEICQNVRCTFRVQRSGLELASSVNLQNNSWYEASDDFVKKKPTISWKTQDENDVRRYPHTEAKEKRVTKSTVCPENFPEFFHTL